MDFFQLVSHDLPEHIWEPFTQNRPAVRYQKNQMIYFQDSEAEYFYFLRSGRVKTYISSADGGEKVLTVYRPGAVFGEAAFFGEIPRVSSAVALTDCEIVRINRSNANSVLENNPALAMALVKYLARTVQLLSGHVDEMAFLTAPQRVARYLLSLPDAENGSIRCTQDEISSAVSANRVTVCRILKRFQNDGLLRTGYGTIQLTDPDGLQEILEHSIS